MPETSPGENERAGGQAGREQAFSVGGAIQAAASAKHEGAEREHLQSDADEDGATGEKKLAFVVRDASPDVNAEGHERPPAARPATNSQPRSGMVTNSRTLRCRKISSLFWKSQAIDVQTAPFARSEWPAWRRRSAAVKALVAAWKVSVFMLSWMRNIMESAKLKAQAA